MKLRRWYMVGMSVAELKPVLQTSTVSYASPRPSPRALPIAQLADPNLPATS
jgi:hypothetical protein